MEVDNRNRRQEIPSPEWWLGSARSISVSWSGEYTFWGGSDIDLKVDGHLKCELHPSLSQIPLKSDIQILRRLKNMKKQGSKRPKENLAITRRVQDFFYKIQLWKWPWCQQGRNRENGDNLSCLTTGIFPTWSNYGINAGQTRTQTTRQYAMSYSTFVGPT